MGESEAPPKAPEQHRRSHSRNISSDSSAGNRVSLRQRLSMSLGRNAAASDASAGESRDSQSLSEEMKEDEEVTYQKFLDGPALVKKCVVGIDFGTTNSGYAYAMTSDKRIRVVQKKEPTCVLFRKDGHQLVEFGLEARNFHRKAMAGQELLTKFGAGSVPDWASDYVYFDQDIKMALFEKNRGDLTQPDPSTGIAYSEVVSAILRRVKETALTRIQRERKVMLGDGDVLWVVTVPSIWRESDKQFMRRCATQAEIIKDEFSGDLVIALESECAGVWAEEVLSKTSSRLNDSDKILCLDCGGGTVDISAIKISKQDKSSVRSTVVQQQQQQPAPPSPSPSQSSNRKREDEPRGSEKEESGDTGMSMAQLLPPTGLKVGSQTIDRRFQLFLKNFLGEANFERLWSQPDPRMELQDGWEKIKCSVTAKHFSQKQNSRVTPMALNLEVTLQELNVKLQTLVDSYNEKARAKPNRLVIQLEVKQSRGILNPLGARQPTKLLIPPALLHYCFDGAVQHILDKMIEVYDNHLKAIGGVEHVIMYGGLGSCEYLIANVKKKMQALQPNCEIHCPEKSSLIVMKGAVKYGMFPKIINSRRARMTVGVKVTTPFVPGVHNTKKHLKHKFYDERTRLPFIRDVFKTFVERDELVNTQERYRHIFAPAGKDSDSIKFDMYASGNRHVDYVTDPGCLKLARIVVPIEKGKMSNITMELSFGFTEIRAFVLDDSGQVVREVPLLFDRVGENAIISENDESVENSARVTVALTQEDL